ncbi:putative cylclic diguanylate phosphodiesterase [Azorhizobium caulinodans ORS 571]|uniref:Putative cylclic diguanylate phosphodiesterase n=1 Tax=Azorhizobium caulinodans (strain ATCC 43989 / DSM 5975 / JCM 20966 / LMG 6465 / NBRC 14845 / NCIMB 13405 / ORS 571) TaxID=438753 RepID=A8IKF7_AZOC5|nr:putative cylclic diguanylate phosphodiesterase [Azorhizobium caulinodans ORS 571]
MKRNSVFDWSPEQRRHRRVRSLLLFGSGVFVALGGGWSVFYGLHGHWVMMAVHLALSALAIPALALIFLDHARAAAIFIAHALLPFVTWLCLIDAPLGDIQRSTHLFLLPIGVGIFFIFSQERAYLRYFLPCLYFVLFIVFQCSDMGVSHPDLMAPERVRYVGMWVNAITAVIALGVVLTLMQVDMASYHQLEGEMRRALARGDFRLHYQPQVDPSRRILGAEALLRWFNPDHGIIPPAKFITLAEETGLIVPLGDWVLRTACAQLALWAEIPATRDLTISVNVSASQFRQPDFVPRVREILAHTGADPSRLKLELTESLFVRDPDVAAEKMSALRDVGLRWSLDDFGTGYSSLHMLRNLPVDEIKIDKTFVSRMASEEQDRAIVRLLIDMCSTLGLFLVAEGVETEEQYRLLQAWGCDGFQGYLFGKAMPVFQFSRLAEAASAASTN